MIASQHKRAVVLAAEKMASTGKAVAGSATPVMVAALDGELMADPIPPVSGCQTSRLRTYWGGEWRCGYRARC
jgi:hypothetical protein